MTDWDALREDVPGTRGKVYLNSCSMGLPHVETQQAMVDYVSQWSGLGAASWHDQWIDAITAWRGEVAALVGATPRQIAWTPSVSAGLASLGGALYRDSARQGLVLARLEFPAAQAAMGLRPGVHIDWVEGTGPGIAARAYAQRIGPDTRAVVASRVLFSTGALQDTKGIMAAARQAGAFGIIDDYQATGQVELDVAREGCDAAVGGSLKWMCGGVASCWMFVRDPEALMPTHAGWWANQRMFDFDGFEPWPDARRFEGGEANVPGILTSTAAMRVARRIGVANIRRRITELRQDLIEKLEQAGIPTLMPPDAARTGIVMVPHEDLAATVHRLQERGIIVDERGGALRVSPHWYNLPNDNDALVQALAQR